MNYLIDTNVMRELRKREHGDPGVVSWAASTDPTDLHTSVLVIGEICHGIELRRRSDASQAIALERWLERIRAGLVGRIHPVDDRVSEVWGRMGVPDPISVVDGLIGATALVHGLTVVTRNTRDMARTGAPVLNPFSEVE